MKCIYWNVRVLPNSLTKLALKRLVNKYKPQFVFISQPWIMVSDCPLYWLKGRYLKVFAMNTIDGQSHNLQCLYEAGWDPKVIEMSDEHIAFSTQIQDKQMGMVAIMYGSINHVTRRNIWKNMSCFLSSFVIPWCLIGDINPVLGSHMFGFICQNSLTKLTPILHHLSTSRNFLTWINGIRGNANTQKRLDRAICH